MEIRARVVPLELGDPRRHLLGHPIDLLLHHRVELDVRTQPLRFQDDVFGLLRIAYLAPDGQLDVLVVELGPQVVPLVKERQRLVVVRLDPERIPPWPLEMLLELRTAEDVVYVDVLGTDLSCQPGQRRLARTGLGALLEDALDRLRDQKRLEHHEALWRRVERRRFQPADLELGPEVRESTGRLHKVLACRGEVVGGVLVRIDRELTEECREVEDGRGNLQRDRRRATRVLGLERVAPLEGGEVDRGKPLLDEPQVGVVLHDQRFRGRLHREVHACDERAQEVELVDIGRDALAGRRPIVRVDVVTEGLPERDVPRALLELEAQ